MEPESFESEHGRLFAALQKEKGTCPDGEVFLAYHLDRLTTSEAQLLEEHLSLCAVCSEFLERLRRSKDPMDEAEWEEVEKRLCERFAPWRSDSKEKSPWTGRRHWLVVAAGVLIFFSGLVVWNVTDRSSISSGTESITRGPVLQLHEPAGVVNDVNTFTWSSPPIASSFRLQIRREGQLIWEAIVGESSYRVPAELSSLLVAGEEFEWRVAALDAESNPVAESSWMEFQLSP